MQTAPIRTLLALGNSRFNDSSFGVTALRTLAQWRKRRWPVKSIAMPFSSAASMHS